MGFDSDRDVLLNELIGRVYDAALDEHLWEGMAQLIAHAFDSTSAVLKIDHGHGQQADILQMTSNLVVADKDSDWADHWHRHDLWVERSREAGLGEIIIGKDVLPDQELERTGFYHDWLRHLDIHGVLGAVFPLGDPHSVGVIGIHRPRKAADFGDPDRRRLAVFLPHLRRALALRERFQRSSITHLTSVQALNRTGTAAYMVDGHARVLYANDLAEQLLSRETCIQLSRARLSLPHAGCASELHRLVRQCVQTASGRATTAEGVMSIPREGKPPLTVLVAPVAPTSHFGVAQPAALIFVRDSEQQGFSSDAARALFGLTRNESHIAAALAQGQSLEQAATALNIGIGTARTHLKSVLAKTGTHRQGELVAMLLRSAASLAD